MDPKAVRSWIMYDWANSAFVTTIMAAVMPIFYADVAGAGLKGNTAETYWGYTQTIAMIFVAVLCPILGAIADYTGSKVRFLSAFMIAGAAASIGMAFIGEGDWLFASFLVVIGTIGYAASNTFYDALLPSVSTPATMNEVSNKGYAMGYLGGGLLLLVNLVMILFYDTLGFPSKTAASQTVFVMVGLWWILFSLPIMRNVKETARETSGFAAAVKIGIRRVRGTIGTLKRYPELLKYMAAFWFFNDGINTVIVMATIYGRGIGIETNDLIAALLITQFVGYPSTLLFIKFASRIGVKKSIYSSLLVYVLIVILGFFMTNAIHFYLLAAMVGLVQGGSQATARSLYAALVPPSRTAEFFGFLSLSSKFASVAGPFVFSVVGTLTGSSRYGILALLAFFIIGIAILVYVDVDKGREEALAAEV
ncbi:MFS transporter [Paenibacillus sacheonensis]|uniref:MFS transporter n=1 Tax=Paenibacillus sacheonensis TaxID=742054 RepID=A0A7X4YQJ3_9BACL|nr:MFS transporter [Paenibacillus sacheonensis]MBM7565324.1 UMF1 family MFS transporter [Paenibacillus sacheonensis]NBC69744.1 MFS transporter [Paenibacillus sacheonensis]